MPTAQSASSSSSAVLNSEYKANGMERSISLSTRPSVRPGWQATPAAGVIAKAVAAGASPLAPTKRLLRESAKHIEQQSASHQPASTFTGLAVQRQKEAAASAAAAAAAAAAGGTGGGSELVPQTPRGRRNATQHAGKTPPRTVGGGGGGGGGGGSGSADSVVSGVRTDSPQSVGGVPAMSLSAMVMAIDEDDELPEEIERRARAASEPPKPPPDPNAYSVALYSWPDFARLDHFDSEDLYDERCFVLVRTHINPNAPPPAAAPAANGTGPAPSTATAAAGAGAGGGSSSATSAADAKSAAVQNGTAGSGSSASGSGASVSSGIATAATHVPTLPTQGPKRRAIDLHIWLGLEFVPPASHPTQHLFIARVAEQLTTPPLAANVMPLATPLNMLDVRVHAELGGDESDAFWDAFTDG